jgi:hypothetical protein
MSGVEKNEAGLVLQKKIMNAFTDEEMLHPDNLTSKQKKEIAIVT